MKHFNDKDCNALKFSMISVLHALVSVAGGVVLPAATPPSFVDFVLA